MNFAELIKQQGYRTVLAVPMLREGVLRGVIVMVKTELEPFTDKQIELVETFADQAVIAIENVRLFDEVQARTHELSEALEQQTATSEVLQVISSSPGELQPVFEAMLENAIRLCEAKYGTLFLHEGDGFRLAATNGIPLGLAEDLRRAGPRRPGPNTALGRVARTKQTAYIADALSEPGFFDIPPGFTEPLLSKHAGARTLVAVPMLKENELVGAIVIYRQEPRPFSDKQIELVGNFAKQAVIAIENTRLLNELRQRTDDLSEALEQQTATSGVLQVIASSPGELAPVFQAMLANAVRICAAGFGTLFRYDGERFDAAASIGTPPALVEFQKERGPFRPEAAEGLLGRVLHTREVAHTVDYAAEAYPRTPGQARRCAIHRRRADAQGRRAGRRIRHLPPGGPPVHRQADRAGPELRRSGRHRHREYAPAQRAARIAAAADRHLRGAAGHSSSPGDLQPVFEAMLENAIRICEAKFGVLNSPITMAHFACGAMHNVAR